MSFSASPGQSTPAEAQDWGAAAIWQGIWQLPVAARPVAQIAPVAVQQATHRLVTIVQTLCAPDSGWPADKPQTAATLLPYVSDEADELLEALYQWRHAAAEMPAGSWQAVSAESSRGGLQSLAAFTADLMWSLAASTPVAMLLMEGVTGLLAVSQSSPARGVRLVPVLTLQGVAGQRRLDLVMQTDLDGRAVLNDSWQLSWAQEATPATAMPLCHWRAYLWQRAIAVAPALSTWRAGQVIQVLLPGQSWQSVMATLQLEFVACAADAVATEVASSTSSPAPGTPAGTPAPRIWLAPATDVLDSVAAVASAAIAPAPYPSRQTRVMTAAEDWQQAAIATALSLDWGAPLQASSEPSPTAVLTTQTLVEAVFQALTPFPAGAGLLSSPPLTLADIVTQVRWGWVQVACEWMPLLSGLPVRQLQPGTPWQTGILVMTTALVFRNSTADVGWLETSPEQWHPAPFADPPLAVVQLLSSPVGGPSLWPGDELRSHLMQVLQQRSPLLAYLMQGTRIELIPPDGEQLPPSFQGALTLQLQLRLQFFPDTSMG